MQCPLSLRAPSWSSTNVTPPRLRTRTCFAKQRPSGASWFRTYRLFRCSLSGRANVGFVQILFLFTEANLSLLLVWQMSYTHDSVNPRPIIPFISQGLSPFLLVITVPYSLSHGRALYLAGGFASGEYFSNTGTVAPYQKWYNVAEYLFKVANDPPVSLFQLRQSHTSGLST